MDAPGQGTSTPTVDAGAWLRTTREAAGLSIDAVAQQLKLAPRQVRALEESLFTELPGRTFVRGFVRNYARLLRLDPEAVVAALPGTDIAPALEGPPIGSSSRPMGELPVAHASRGPSWSRWAIPTALAAAIMVAAVYEFMRPVAVGPGESASPVKSLPIDPVAPSPAAGTPLPNPVTGDTATEAAAVDEPARVPEPAPATTPQASVPPATPISTAPADAAPAATAPATGEPLLVIRYRASAWTQVKDATGQVLLVTNGEAGTSQNVTGKPPLDLVIGNATEASITWRGQPFDLAPHVRANNIARVRLP